MSAVAFQVISLTKRCRGCEEIKGAEEFSTIRSRADGLASYCRTCDSRLRRARFTRKDPAAAARVREKQRVRQNKPSNLSQCFRNYVKRHYGITLEAARGMLRAQRGLCANKGCDREITFEVHGRSVRRAVIDHCHATKKVRGILCHRCNTAAGVFEKNRNRFAGLFEYLKSSVA